MQNVTIAVRNDALSRAFAAARSPWNQRQKMSGVITIENEFRYSLIGTAEAIYSATEEFDFWLFLLNRHAHDNRRGLVRAFDKLQALDRFGSLRLDAEIPQLLTA